MSVIDRIKEKAKTNVKHIVLAEGSEPRTGSRKGAGGKGGRNKTGETKPVP